MSNNQDVKQSTLTGLTCFSIGFRLWSARKKLRAEDLKGTAAANLPPADLASLGSKKLIDTKVIAVFDTLKKRAERYLSSIGVSFEGLGAWAVPDDKVAEVAAHLEAIKAEFEVEKAKFINQYDDHVTKWMKDHKEWEHIIRNYVESSLEVGSKIQCSWRCFKVVAAVDDQSSALNNGLNDDIGGLAGQLYKETAAAATGMLKNVTSIGAWRERTLSPLRSIRSKLNGLSMLDGGVSTLVDSIDHVLASMPGKGPFVGPEVSQAFMLLQVLSDEHRMRQHIKLVSQGTSLDMLFAVPDRSSPQEQLQVQPASETTALTAAVDGDSTETLEIFDPGTESTVVHVPMETLQSDSDDNWF